MKKILNGLRFVWKNNRVWLLVTTGVLVFLLVVSLIITQVTLIRNTFNTLFGDYRTEYIGSRDEYYRFKPDDGLENKTDALEAANALNERITEEGFVLLENNGVLPLAVEASDPVKLSVFGKNSVNLVYGGSGSGSMDSENAVTIKDSLEKAGYIVNSELWDFYSGSASGSGRGNSPGMGDLPTGFPTGETELTAYTQSVKDSYAEFNDAAIVVFSRIGGEGYDLPRTSINTSGRSDATQHYLELDDNEKALLTEVTKNFDNVIVIINSSTPMELGFLSDGSYDIDAALWIGSPGGTGIASLGRLLNGSATPSGHLVDTYARLFENDPTWQNFGTNGSTTGNVYTVNGGATEEHFVEYEESIYIGYRYYETRGYTEFLSSGDYSWYDDAVVYPFGYGKSYTDFEWTVTNVSPAAGAVLGMNDTIKITVNVKNTGEDYAGKDVIQMYYTSPYTAGKIEKAHVVLGDFAKTETLAPGGDGEVTLSLKVSDMASYDYDDANGNGFKGYELDGGTYVVRLGTDANNAWRDSAFEYSFTVPDGGYRYDGETEKGKNVENRFDNVSAHFGDTSATLMSRDGWMNYPSVPTAEDKEVSRSFIDMFTEEAYIGSGRNLDRDKPWYRAERPKYSLGEVPQDEALQLYELIGKDYDDPMWDKLLDQLTLEQMAYLIGTGNFNTAAIQNISKPKTTDPDGPAGFTNFMSVANPPVYDTCFYASECVIGATWNKQLAYDMGVSVGNEALFGNERGDGVPYSGWYAPAVNIHRSPFSGRNWEYYSEDGYLSGIMGANTVLGAQSKGVYTYVKHFALNDQETHRGGIATWASEQTMREIYFKPFELVVKVGQTHAIMSSFNRIGTVWTGGCYELLTGLLRDEWGFVGMVISDYNTYDHMPANQMIRAGGDLNLIQDKQPDIKGNAVTASHLWAMRNATKNILYTVAHSNAMNGLGEGVTIVYSLPYWMIIMIVVDVVAVVAFALWGFFSIRSAIKKSA